MRIGILSDTHDRRERAAQAVKVLVKAGADALIHCGDLTEPEIVYECALRPSYFVFGNNDYDEDGIRTAIDAIGGVCLGWGGEVTLVGRRIAVTHGDQGKEVRRLIATRPDYFLFGHSHVPADERDGATRWINPGALHRAAEWTVALLDLDTDDLEFLKIR
jgi:putative phosphoesterase